MDKDIWFKYFKELCFKHKLKKRITQGLKSYIEVIINEKDILETLKIGMRTYLFWNHKTGLLETISEPICSSCISTLWGFKKEADEEANIEVYNQLLRDVLIQDKTILNELLENKIFVIYQLIKGKVIHIVSLKPDLTIEQCIEMGEELDMQEFLQQKNG